MRNTDKYIRGTGKHRQMYIPELDEWVFATNMRKRLATINMTAQQYYDKHIKHDTEGICAHPNCQCTTEFRSIAYGYAEFCSHSCAKSNSMKYRGEAARRSAWVKNASKDPAYRQKISEGTKRGMAKPEVRKKISDGVIAIMTPEHRQKISEGTKRGMAKLEVRKKISDGCKRSFIVGRSTRMHIKYAANHIRTTHCVNAKNDTIYVKSSFERAFAAALDALNISYSYENVRIQYYDTEKQCDRTYIIDFTVHMHNNKDILVEIKPAKFTNTQNARDKTLAAQKFCKDSSQYIAYIIMTEHDIFNVDTICNILQTVV